MSIRRRLLLVTSSLAALTLALTGCLSAMIPDEAKPSPGPSRAPVVDGVSAELLPFYEQAVDWQPCDGVDGGYYDCATVTAPLNWDEPGAGEIDLAVIRRHSDSGEPIASLLTNPGGPGASGVALVRDSASFATGEALRQNYDVIGFDPRGVGESTAVRCFDAAEMDAYLYDLPQNPRGSVEWEEELTDRNAEFAESCEANSDGILPYITTIQAAHDLDLLRGVLGDHQLHYLGYSYGTFLGATYAKLYPERVGRLVLDGAIDPAVSGLEVGITQAVGFESALRAFMAACLEGQDCPFRGTVDDAMADLGTLLASVDARPLQGADGRQLGADSLMTGIIAALYAQGSWPFLIDALADALEGNPDLALQLADFYNGRQGGVYTDNSTEAFRAYNCMDYPVSDGTEEAAAETLLNAQAPTVAPYWSGPDSCSVWPYPPTGVREPIAAEGAPPIVVVGSTNDPATPYEWSVSLANQLASGVLVTRVGEGHTGYNKGNACVDAAVEAYLVDGTVPEDGLRCE
ncbi:alpha/beta hydrolase [Microbacterium sp. zg-YB36]|uniref:alpha/beta hydrolase n=1 Tax=Microbacterium sp. zg-YB36 TaxID=2969407 RepID=UPI00214C410A|nr:alpha/beta hydrolase [Microbacterium sp. zg-YB36]MDL5351215.1 alpha/beta hydrolase [Microbacterium sp. zg-YB36]